LSRRPSEDIADSSVVATTILNNDSESHTFHNPEPFTPNLGRGLDAFDIQRLEIFQKEFERSADMERLLSTRNSKFGPTIEQEESGGGRSTLYKKERVKDISI